MRVSSVFTCECCVGRNRACPRRNSQCGLRYERLDGARLSASGQGFSQCWACATFYSFAQSKISDELCTKLCCRLIAGYRSAAIPSQHQVLHGNNARQMSPCRRQPPNASLRLVPALSTGERRLAEGGWQQAQFASQHVSPPP
eukprot:6180029-Pleurochrysis_carterae.AAC.5